MGREGEGENGEVPIHSLRLPLSHPILLPRPSDHPKPFVLLSVGKGKGEDGDQGVEKEGVAGEGREGSFPSKPTRPSFQPTSSWKDIPFSSSAGRAFQPSTPSFRRSGRGLPAAGAGFRFSTRKIDRTPGWQRSRRDSSSSFVYSAGAYREDRPVQDETFTT